MFVPPGKYDPTDLVAKHGHGLRSLARAVGVDPAVLCRPITQWQADRFAIRAGWHPAEVWGAEAWCEPVLVADRQSGAAAAEVWWGPLPTADDCSASAVA